MLVLLLSWDLGIEKIGFRVRILDSNTSRATAFQDSLYVLRTFRSECACAQSDQTLRRVLCR